jgi:hypothetical protein
VQPFTAFQVINDIRDYNKLGGLKKHLAAPCAQVHAVKEVCSHQNQAMVALVKLKSYGSVMTAVVAMSTTTTTIMLLLGPVTAHAASSGWSDGYARGTYDYANGNAFNDHCSFAYSNSYCFDYRL